MNSLESLIQHISSLRTQIDQCEVGKYTAYKDVMANQPLENILPTYQGVIEGIEQIARKLFNRDSYTIQEAPFKGHSGSVLYQIIDPTTEKTLGLAKIFAEDKSNEFLDEVFSLRAYVQHGIVCPNILDVGLIQENPVKKSQKTRCVMIEEMIPGETLKSHLSKLFDHEITSKARATQMTQTIELFKAFGSSLADFHSKGCSEPKPMDPYVREHLLGIMNDTIEELRKADLEVYECYGVTDKVSFMTSLQEYIKNNKSLMESPGPRSYIHADASFGNFICGEDKQIHLFDTWWGAYSVDAKGAPRGTPFVDYVQVMNRIWYFHNDGKLSSDEYKSLQAAFQHGYKISGVIPNEDVQNFYSFIDAMLLIGGVTKWFHQGTKDTFGHLVRYWVTWMKEVSILQPEEAPATAV